MYKKGISELEKGILLDFGPEEKAEEDSKQAKGEKTKEEAKEIIQARKLQHKVGVLLSYGNIFIVNLFPNSLPPSHMYILGPYRHTDSMISDAVCARLFVCVCCLVYKHGWSKDRFTKI